MFASFGCEYGSIVTCPMLHIWSLFHVSMRYIVHGMGLEMLSHASDQMVRLLGSCALKSSLSLLRSFSF